MALNHDATLQKWHWNWPLKDGWNYDSVGLGKGMPSLENKRKGEKEMQ